MALRRPNLGLAGISKTEPKLVKYLSELERYAVGMEVQQTSEELHLYANGTTGDDANDGLTPSTPVKTLNRIDKVKPYILRHNTTLHLRGTFTQTSNLEDFFSGYISNQFVSLVIDGGPDTVVIAGPFTSDINATDRIGLSSLSEVPDVHSGYWLEVLDGPAAGEMRTLVEHDATTFYPARFFSVDPGAGAQFQIVRPATTITSTGSYQPIRNNMGGVGYIRFQRLYFSGPGAVLENDGDAFFAPSHCISDSSDSNGVFRSRGGSRVLFTGVLMDPDTFAVVSPSLSYGAISARGTVGQVRLAGVSTYYGWFAGFARSLLVQSVTANNWCIADGTRILGPVTVKDLHAGDFDGPFIRPTTTGQPIKIKNAAGVGLSIDHARVSLEVVGAAPPIEISGCGSHAIEVRNGGRIDSRPGSAPVVNGSGNGGAGLYIHSGGSMFIKDGLPPAVTGTVGDVSLDGTTQASTWAAIDAGTPINGATVGNDEFVVVKEV